MPSVTRTNPVSVDAMSTRDREGPYSLRVYEDDDLIANTILVSSFNRGVGHRPTQRMGSRRGEVNM